MVITLAGHASAMASETAIGAASPVGNQGEDLGETIETKQKEILKATVRSLASERGEDAIALAESAIDDAIAASAEEALNVGMIDFIADDLDQLLQDNFELEGPRWNQKYYVTYRISNYNWLAVVTTPSILRLDFLLKAGKFKADEVAESIPKLDIDDSANEVDDTDVDEEILNLLIGKLTVSEDTANTSNQD